MLPNIQVGVAVVATQRTTLTLGLLICDPGMLWTLQGCWEGSTRQWAQCGQPQAWPRGRFEKWEFPFFSCSPPPQESAESQVKDPLGFLWAAGWRAGGGGVVWSFFPLWDPAIWFSFFLFGFFLTSLLGYNCFTMAC